MKKEQIESILKSNQGKNNLLSYELLQSQLELSQTEALEFILEYHIKHIWADWSTRATIDLEYIYVDFYFFHDYDAAYDEKYSYLALELMKERELLKKEWEYTGEVDYYGREDLILKDRIEEAKELFQKVIPLIISLLKS